MLRGMFRFEVSLAERKFPADHGLTFSLQPPCSLPSFLIMDFEYELDRRSTAFVDRAIQPFGLIDLGQLKSAVKP